MHEALREATREVHIRLEQALALTDAGLSRGAYRLLVEAFYGFYEPLERRLASVAGLPFEGRAKVDLLRADLRAVDPNAADASVELPPRCEALPDVSTPARALGCLYVLEGATLGRRFIVRALQEHLDIGPATGGAFFEGYGAETAAMWCALLEHIQASPGPRAETVAGAVDTFVTLERWLAIRGVLR